MRRKIPLLRKKKSDAVVTLTDQVLGLRRDFYCGKWGSPESRQKYAHLILQWESAGRQWPGQKIEAAMTVEQLILSYLEWAVTYYTSNEMAPIKAAMRVLRDTCGHCIAPSFSVSQLALVQAAMVNRGWTRKSINRQVKRVAGIFKWAASQDLFPSSVWEQLRTIRPLKKGKTTAIEAKPVKPVPADQVDVIRPHVSRQVWALIELQRYCGCRGGEILGLRPADIDRSGPVWRTVLVEHKNAYRGLKRTLHFGPRAQAVLSPWLEGRPADAYLFSPAEAEAERLATLHARRKTPLSCGNRPGTNRGETSSRRPGARYTRDSYSRAIARGCDAADLWAKAGKVVGVDERLVPRWNPHRLRHLAATEIRRQFGLEAAAAVLGHSSAKLTDQVYAERDISTVERIMQQIG